MRGVATHQRASAAARVDVVARSSSRARVSKVDRARLARVLGWPMTRVTPVSSGSSGREPDETLARIRPAQSGSGPSSSAAGGRQVAAPRHGLAYIIAAGYVCLFPSLRTVEIRLQHVYEKLGIAGREERPAMRPHERRPQSGRRGLVVESPPANVEFPAALSIEDLPPPATSRSPRLHGALRSQDVSRWSRPRTRSWRKRQEAPASLPSVQPWLQRRVSAGPRCRSTARRSGQGAVV